MGDIGINYSKIYGYIYPKEDADFVSYDNILKNSMIVAEHREKELNFKKDRKLLNFGTLFKEFKNHEEFEFGIKNLHNSLKNSRMQVSKFIYDLEEGINYREYAPYGENHQSEPTKNVKDIFERLLRREGRLNVLYENEDVYLVSNTSNILDSFIILKEHLHLIGKYERINLEYYDNLSLNDIKLTLQNQKLDGDKKDTDLLNKDFSNIKGSEVNKVKENLSNKLANYEKEIEDIENFKTEELAELKAEMDKIKEKLDVKVKIQKDIIAKKKEELEIKVKEFEKKIFFLNVDLNSLMYYLGDKLNIVQLTDGIPTSSDQPIIVYQKLRYLDLEMARYCSLKKFNWNSRDSFEELLKNRIDLLETFNPSEKSISFFKFSKFNHEIDYSIHHANALKEYQKDHAKELGFVIRDGRKSFVGWLNDESITVDEKVFLSFKDEIKEESESKITTEIDKEREKDKEKIEMSSRYILFHLLQGLIDSDNGFFNLNERPNILRDTIYSKQVIFTLADTWIEDNRFGNYNDIMSKYAMEFSYDEKLYPIKGEKIITIQKIKGTYDKYDNRNMGVNNIVHDASVKDKEIYTINKVENGNRYYSSKVCVSEEKGWSRERFEHPDNYKWDDNFKPLKRVARANIPLFEDEYIRLTFLNTVLLNYIINLKDLGKNRVNYPYMAGYFSKMLSFLEEREESELKLIKKYYKEIDEINEWQMILSDWKLDNAVKGEFTDYQAKRFSKHLVELKNK